jgi:hypothetical protein
MRAMILSATVAFVAFQPPSVGAEPASCSAWRAQCVRECTPAVIQRGAPVGCTCEARFQACRSSGVWANWRTGGPGHAVADKR